jgi:hypothetical protein
MDCVGLENSRCRAAQSDRCVSRWPGGLSSAAIDSLRQITEKKIGTNRLAQVTVLFEGICLACFLPHGLQQCFATRENGRSLLRGFADQGD